MGVVGGVADDVRGLVVAQVPDPEGRKVTGLSQEVLRDMMGCRLALATMQRREKTCVASVL